MSKIALVTGASRGLGLETARRLGRQEGSTVIVGARAAAAGERAVHELREEGIDAELVLLDVTSPASVADAADRVAARHGRLDVLVNNAGLQHVAPLEAFPTEKFERLVRVMLVAPFIATKHVFPRMKAQRYGRILNMASINGLVGFAGKAAYNSAKHGLIGLTKVAALEGAPHGITVNALCPGYVDTPLVRNQLADLARTRNVPLEHVLEDVIYPLVPLRRLLSVDEIARYAAFLVAEGAGGITGQPVVIDGGYTAQ
jgi:3-hydroxybutyrate dehydrogenase